MKKGFSEKNVCKQMYFTVSKMLLLFYQSLLFCDEQDVFETFEEGKIKYLRLKTHPIIFS